ncbi:sugar ABC transporter substrate-binding protein [Jeotgalibacillus sp. ET6]|uniref:sugar ABC transporter substrate-binding protein n=1 Tax=Jeotgalibacillus sp. ET6 TaxID=3037260 RepID=UPI0024186DC3|nr:sugar ABC transporter substrate-binding protein [Jeotgalibacillus sp. ET6]MDG5472677.1 sugar ABC transporter substrate-binding protein [Jeotgalibacillus sp. ET6]
MKKKGLVVPAVLAMGLSTALAGCGGGDGSGDSDNTLSVWAMGEEGKLLDEMTEAYEEENPDITVNVQAIPWDQAYDKLLTAVASGNGPDVLQLGTTWVAEFADAGALLDLTEHKEDYPDFNLDNYFEGAQTSMKYEDQIVGIPWYVETRTMYYRTDLLEEVGYSEAPATWDELKDAATKLSESGEDVYGLDIDLNDQITPFIFAWQNGFEFDTENPNFTSPEFTEALEYYTSYFKEGISTTSEGIDIIQAFKDGQKPIFFSGPWMINILNDQAADLEGQWAVATMPAQKSNVSSIGGANFSVFHNSEKVDEALDFISYMNEVDTQLEWMEKSNTLPSRLDAWEDPALAEDEMYSVFGEQLENTKGAPPIKEWEKIAQELLSSIERINIGGADVEEELESFNEKAKTIIE